jgi:hypothetical protein
MSCWAHLFSSMTRKLYTLAFFFFDFLSLSTFSIYPRNKWNEGTWKMDDTEGINAFKLNKCDFEGKTDWKEVDRTVIDLDQSYSNVFNVDFIDPFHSQLTFIIIFIDYFFLALLFFFTCPFNNRVGVSFFFTHLKLNICSSKINHEISTVINHTLIQLKITRFSCIKKTMPSLRVTIDWKMDIMMA